MSTQGVIKGFSSTLKSFVLPVRSFRVFRIGKLVSPQIFGSTFQSSFLVSVHLLVSAGDCQEEKNRRLAEGLWMSNPLPESLSLCGATEENPMCGESGT